VSLFQAPFIKQRRKIMKFLVSLFIATQLFPVSAFAEGDSDIMCDLSLPPSDRYNGEVFPKIFLSPEQGGTGVSSTKIQTDKAAVKVYLSVHDTNSCTRVARLNISVERPDYKLNVVLPGKDGRPDRHLKGLIGVGLLEAAQADPKPKQIQAHVGLLDSVDT